MRQSEFFLSLMFFLGRFLLYFHYLRYHLYFKLGILWSFQYLLNHQQLVFHLFQLFSQNLFSLLDLTKLLLFLITLLVETL